MIPIIIFTLLIIITLGFNIVISTKWYEEKIGYYVGADYTPRWLMPILLFIILILTIIDFYY
jgi:hypothetical protein